MADRARVHSIDALRTFRPHLVKFVEECSVAVSSADADAGRALLWLKTDRVPYWKREIRVRNDELNRAKGELIAKESLKGIDNDARSTLDEKKKIDKAKRRIAEAEEKLKNCKRWLRQLERETQKYHGGVQPLKRAIDADLPHAISELDRMAKALEAYAAAGKRPAATPRPDQTKVAGLTQPETGKSTGERETG